MDLPANKSPGKVRHGSNFGDEVKIPQEKDRERNSDLFGLKRLNKLGPQDYDPVIQGKTSPKILMKEQSPLPQNTGSVKKQMESYLTKVFDKEKDKKPTETPSCVGLKQSFGMRPKTLEEIQPFSVDKRDMTFKSKVERKPLDPDKN